MAYQRSFSRLRHSCKRSSSVWARALPMADATLAIGRGQAGEDHVDVVVDVAVGHGGPSRGQPFQSRPHLGVVGGYCLAGLVAAAGQLGPHREQPARRQVAVDGGEDAVERAEHRVGVPDDRDLCGGVTGGPVDLLVGVPQAGSHQPGQSADLLAPLAHIVDGGFDAPHLRVGESLDRAVELVGGDASEPVGDALADLPLVAQPDTLTIWGRGRPCQSATRRAARSAGAAPGHHEAGHGGQAAARC